MAGVKGVSRVQGGGMIGALDRIPRKELLAEARAAADRHGTKLLVSPVLSIDPEEEFGSQQQSVTPQICFGGNGRSEGFSPMVRDDDARQRFVAELLALCETVSPNA